MKKDLIQQMELKLHTKYRMLFRSFFINLALGILAWVLLTLLPILLYIAVWATGVSPMVMYFSIIGGIAMWQMLGVVLFLVPAISASIEYRAVRRC